MRPRRTLALRREALLELRDDDLSRIGGAGSEVLPSVPWTECADKISNLLECESSLRPCVTHTCP